MLIFDGDYPMAYGALDLNRNLTLPIAEARTQPDKEPATQSPNAGIMATPEGKATAADLANFATGGVTMLVSNVS